MSQTHEFLSDGWFEAAKAIAEKYADQIPPINVAVTMNQVVTEAPFGDGTVKTRVDTSSGRLQMEQGEHDTADVTMTLDYGTARKLFVDQDQAAVMQAFMSGKIKVQGDMGKMLAMQAGQGVPTEAAKQAADELKAMTA
jgi:putative sterol carrier protein